MMSSEQPTSDTKQSVIVVIKTRWLHYRRKRFWVIVLVLLYTLLGFFTAPLIIKNSVIDLLREDFGRVAQISNVEVNPYVLSLKVEGFALNDKDDVELLSFDEVFVNFQLSSLFNWAWTFDEIRLNSPYFYFERFSADDSRVHQLLDDFKASRPPGPDSESDSETNGSAARLLIRILSINDGRIDVRDNVPATAVETQLASINIAIHELNTLPDHDGKQSVTIELPDDASLNWSGSLTLAPLHSEGELQLEGLHLDPGIAYLESMFPLETLSAKLSSRFKYSLHLDSAGELDIDINDLEAGLKEILLSGLTPQSNFVEIPEISLQGGSLKFPEQTVRIGSVDVKSPRLEAWLNENRDLSLLDLLPAKDENRVSSHKADTASPWQISLDKFTLSGGSLAFRDLSIKPVASVGISELRVTVSDISNQPDALIPVELDGKLAEGGSYALNGKLTVIPGFSLTATASTDGIPLKLGQPYVQQFAHILIEGGELDSDIELELTAGQAISIGGSLRIPNLEVNDSLENQPLLAWESLNIDKFDLNSEGLHLSQVIFKQSFGRFVIREDRSTNLASLLIDHGKANSAEHATEPMSIIIGGIKVDEGSLDFADFSLPLPFATHIVHLDGTISTISTNSATPANIRLEGQVDEYGLARIDGNINMFDPIQHTDITVEFRNLLMSNLSPYTVQFAGREIDEGKLDLGLVYAIDEGLLHGQNDVVLSDLILGEKVDHPDAASLPLGLAVALLKDSDGVIKIDLPVSGDINDPEFKIGGVIWQAVTGMIAKLVSAPFRLLGNLIGIDSEDLGQFEFLAGRYDLTPPELEKITQLEQALNERPELVVEISGVSDPEIDVPALKFIRLRQLVEQRLEKELGDNDDSAMMLDVEIREVVETLFRERFPETPVDSLKPGFISQPADDPEAKPELDELAFATELWNRLLAAEVIDEQDLEELASARAEVISNAFLANGVFDQGRVMIAASKKVESEDGEWVNLELSVASD